MRRKGGGWGVKKDGGGGHGVQHQPVKKKREL